MNHSVVLYSSRYGAAKEYARMLSESLGCTAYNVKETPLDVAGQARRIILCGGIYAGGLSSLPWGLRPGTKRLSGRSRSAI